MLTSLVHFHAKHFFIGADANFAFEMHVPGELTTVLKKELADFRNHQFQNAPYLLSDTQNEIETKLKIDNRSFHFVARKKTSYEIVGTVRLTPYPFELSELLQNSRINFTELKNKLEISRLVTDPSVRDVGKKLLLFAGIHAMEQASHDGFIAICQKEKMGLFKKFGMHALNGPEKVKGRPHDYFVIASNFRTMKKAVMKSYVTRLIKKFRESHGAVSK
jgi:hypothetical protein